MYDVTVTIIAVLSISALMVLIFKGGYFTKILVKLGLKENTAQINWTAFSWESCLQKLNYKADIVFFGDSIIRGGDFHKHFCDLEIINLGCSGDTLSGMINRISMVQAVSPEKIFLLGGINGLTDYNIKKSANKYDELINELHNAVPRAQIYVHSLLPLSAEKEKSICKNKTIEAFNSEIKQIAEKYGFTFIDLYSLYVFEGKMNPKLTKDGIHLQPEAYTLWIEKIAKYMK